MASDSSAPFVAQMPFEAKHPNALAVYCSDGRFTEPVEELARHLGHERIDTLTLPGGPGLLNRFSADYLESDMVTRAAHFLIRGHHIQEVLLLAHAQCGYYQSRHGALGAAFVAEQQVTDLHAAAQELRKVFPQLAVHLYFVRPHGTAIHFEAVPER